MARAFQLFLGLLQVAHLIGLVYSIVEMDMLRSMSLGAGKFWALLPVSHLGAIFSVGALWRGRQMAFVWLSAFSALVFIVYAQIEPTFWFGWAALGSWIVLSYFRVKLSDMHA
ncbi:MAG: hypothetical protein MK209_02440 [Planctomycetes bacterium]|nr:hypothetical protein [Planctomycetota bacterium]